MNISAKHILVTGAGRRLGRALSEHFLRKGARLTAHYRHSAQDVESLKHWSLSHGFNPVFPYQADLQNPLELTNLVTSAISHLGKIDILINCASDFFPTPALQTTMDQWNQLVNTNARGPYFLAQAVAREMSPGGGVIINFCDIHAQKPLKHFCPYVASKAALLMLTRNMALELAPNIRVNSVSPGPVLFPANFTEEQKQNHINQTLLKRSGSTEDIVSAVVFLIENDYLTGFDLKVDGGQSLV